MWSSGFGTQMLALTGRHWTYLMRHPILVGTNLLSTGCISVVCWWAFWHVNLDLSGGVLQRMGLLFFLGAGTIGFLSSWWFVWMIYGAVKVD